MEWCPWTLPERRRRSQESPDGRIGGPTSYHRLPSPSEEPAMTVQTGAKPHPIFLAGRWVESPDPLVIANPALSA